MTEPWQMGTHLRVLRESYLMNTTWQVQDGYKISLHPCALAESSLSIGRLKGPLCMKGLNVGDKVMVL